MDILDTGNLWPPLSFLGELYNFCNYIFLNVSQWWYVEEWHTVYFTDSEIIEPTTI